MQTKQARRSMAFPRQSSPPRGAMTAHESVGSPTHAPVLAGYVALVVGAFVAHVAPVTSAAKVVSTVANLQYRRVGTRTIVVALAFILDDPRSSEFLQVQSGVVDTLVTLAP